MNELPTQPGSPPNPPAAAADIDVSCRLPLLVLFISGAIWLLIGSLFELLASLKFHSPDIAADCPLLTYGRVHAAYLDSFLYGFAVQAGLGLALWLLARLGRTTLSQPWLATFGAALWNLGVTVGVAGLLAGDSTGFEFMELPGYAAVLVFLGYLLLGVSAVLTFHQRAQRSLFVSQWFVFAALFWFAWIFSTAYLLLVTFPVRGVAQAVIAWWYADNLLAVWLSLVGLAAVFYFVPKLAGRDLHSRYLALFTFWLLILFAGWGGIPDTAPLPAWMPTLSTVATVLTTLPLLAVALNVGRTLGRGVPAPIAAPDSDRAWFVVFGAAAFGVAGFMKVFGVVLNASQMLHFTWFAAAQTQLHAYGFFAMVAFGAIYYVLPRLTGTDFPMPGAVRLHFWLAAGGVVLLTLPLAIGGVVQALQLRNAAVPFLQIMKTMLVFLRASTMGDVLLLLGHLVFLGNLAGLVNRFYRARVEAAYAQVTADLFKAAEAKS